MVKIAMLLPSPSMCEIAREEIEKRPSLYVDSVEYVPTGEIAARARELEQQEYELIIARGIHASIIKRTVKMPLVEMQITTQELGKTILALKEDLGREHPDIGLITIERTVGDTSQYDELFGICLHRYSLDYREPQRNFVEQAIRDGCQAVVGGELVCEQARVKGLPCRFFASGIESINRALDTAARVCYAIEMEKRNSVEMATMLDNAFGGIMQLDQAGVIRRINRVGCSLLEQSPNELLGKKVTQVMPGIGTQILEDALAHGKEAYAFVMEIHDRAVIANLAPIDIGDALEGAILTFHEGQRIIDMDSELRRELYQRGHIAKFSFDKIAPRCKDIAPTLALARRIARYTAPVLLTGEPGSGKGMIAQCIHNESLAKGNAFVSLDCSAWMPETLDNMLFGNYTTKKDSPACLAELAQDGTLYLSHIEDLSMETQYKLFSLINGKFLHNGSNRPVATNVRIIAATEVNLVSRIEQGTFRRDLYYAVSVLNLQVPPLRHRREDIVSWVKFYLGEWQKQYNRYVHLTNDAWRFLKESDWPGNMDQVNNVCERMVLLTEKRNIDATFIRKQMEEVAPRLAADKETMVLFKDQKGAEISELLRKYGGNRSMVAAELGVSKTTLWRYIKKYGIRPDFSY